MTEKKINAIISFFSGDAAVSLAFIWLSEETVHVFVKIALTVIIGVVGGFTGLAGKDLYEYTKVRIKKWREK